MTGISMQRSSCFHFVLPRPSPLFSPWNPTKKILLLVSHLF
jgi:hypothetical protein